MEKLDLSDSQGGSTLPPVDAYQAFDSPRRSDFEPSQIVDSGTLSDFDGIKRPQYSKDGDASKDSDAAADRANGAQDSAVSEKVVGNTSRHADEDADSPGVDILCLLPGRVAGFRRCKGFKVYSMNDFYNYTNVRVDKIFDIHLFSAPYWNHWPLWNQDLVYNAYNPSEGVLINPANIAQHAQLSPAIRKEYDFSIIDRFGGSKNFLTSTNYMIADAIESGAKRIHIHATLYISGEEYQEQLPSFLSMLDFVEKFHPDVKITVFPKELTKVWQFLQEGWMKFDGGRIKSATTRETIPIVNYINKEFFGGKGWIEIVRTDKKVSSVGLPELQDNPVPYHIAGIRMLYNEPVPEAVLTMPNDPKWGRIADHLYYETEHPHPGL